MRAKLLRRINPIIIKELRSRMRGARAFWILTIVLLLQAGISYLIYRMAARMSMGYMSSSLSPQIGQTLFTSLVFLVLMMVCAVAPAVTSGAISGEKEKQTLEMLLATPLRPVNILWGKLVSALSYVFLLIFAVVPIASLIFIFGGVTLREMFKALVVLTATAVFLGVLGLFMSAILGRTARATIFSYLSLVGLLFGTIVAYIAAGLLGQGEPPRWILVANPVSLLSSAITPSTPTAGFPLGLIGILGADFRVWSGNVISLDSIPRPLYHYGLPLYAGISIVLFLISILFVQPNRRGRIRWKEVLVALLLILGVGGAAAGAFALTADRYENASIFARPTPAPAFIQQGMVVEEVAVEVLVSGPLTPSPEGIPTATPIDPLTLTPPGEPTWTPPGLPPIVPTSTPLGLSSPTPGFSLDDQPAIYEAAIAQRLTVVVDPFNNGLPESSTVYLIHLDDEDLAYETVPFSKEVQESLAAAMENGPMIIEWVDEIGDVPVDPDTGVVLDGGFILELGNIHLREDGSVLVAANLYLPDSTFMSGTYILEKVEGVWQVTGELPGSR